MTQTLKIEDAEIVSRIRGLRGPTLYYDNYCKLCYRIAKIVWRLSRGRIAVVGMYSEEALWIRSLVGSEIYPTMSWLIVPEKGLLLGGRASMVPIVKEIFKGIVRGGSSVFRDPPPKACSEIMPCSGIKGLVYRILATLVKTYKARIVLDLRGAVDG